MLMTVLVLLLVAIAMAWLQAPAKPQPVRTRRNVVREELLAAYMEQQATNRRW